MNRAGMTKAQAKEAAQALGMSVIWSAEWREFRVSYPLEHYMGQGLTRLDAIARREDQACYTPDVDDALDTARAMATARDSARAAYPEHFA